MSKLDKAIQRGESTMLLAEEDFAASVKDIEPLILKEIQKIFDALDIKGGKIQNTESAILFLASIDKRINEALKKAGYPGKVKEYLRIFDIIRRNNIDIHKIVNNVNISYSSLNAITGLETQNTYDKLLGSGINKDFIFPIREALFRNIIINASIRDVKNTLEQYIISDKVNNSRLLKYTSQVSRDSMSQYDGSIQTIIKKNLNLKDFIYTGSIIKDSRCQCRYWTNKVKLKSEELVDEIATALNGGLLSGCKCSGMIPGTTVENFAVNRGGYFCRHRAIATNLK